MAFEEILDISNEKGMKDNYPSCLKKRLKIAVIKCSYALFKLLALLLYILNCNYIASVRWSLR